MRGIGKFAVGLLLLLGVASPASAELFVLGTDNEAFFNNFENVYDSDGEWRSPSSIPEVGDFFVGIVNVQNIDSLGATHWFQASGLFSPENTQLSGVFAQEITGILVDPSDPTHLLLTFGNPSLDTFCKGADCFTLGFSANEMFRFYLDSPASSLFESNGTLADDVTKATNGSLLFSLGLLVPTDVAGSDVDLIGPGGLPGGRAFGALSLIQNNTGIDFQSVTSEGFTADLVFTSEFERNPGGLASGGSSPWEFRSNDPAVLHPVPEVSSLWMLGMGLTGLVSRRRKVARC